MSIWRSRVQIPSAPPFSPVSVRLRRQSCGCFLTPGRGHRCMFQTGLIGLVGSLGAVSKIVLLVLFVFSVISWAIIFSKWRAFLNGGRGGQSGSWRSWRKHEITTSCIGKFDELKGVPAPVYSKGLWSVWDLGEARRGWCRFRAHRSAGHRAAGVPSRATPAHAARDLSPVPCHDGKHYSVYRPAWDRDGDHRCIS